MSDLTERRHRGGKVSRIRCLPPLFWIGLFPVVVVLCLWAASCYGMIYWTRCRVWDHNRGITIMESAVTFAATRATELEAGQAIQYEPYGPLGKTGYFGMVGFQAGLPVHGPGAWPGGPGWFPPLEMQTIGPNDYGHYAMVFVSRSLKLPFWLILLGYLPLWLAVAWWQARRRRKRIEMDAPEG